MGLQYFIRTFNSTNFVDTTLLLALYYYISLWGEFKMMRSFICGALVLLLLISTQAQAAQPEVTITEVFVDFETETIAIMGENFDLGPDPLTVTLGTFGSLNIITAESNLINVDFPDGGLLVGDFLLTVSSGPGPRKNDDHIVTIGAVGPEGPEGAEGAEGLTGPQGDTGTTGATGLQGPQGETGATGAQGVEGPRGDQGDQGPQGMDGTPALFGANWRNPTTAILGGDLIFGPGQFIDSCCSKVNGVQYVAVGDSCGSGDPAPGDAEDIHVQYSGNCITAPPPCNVSAGCIDFRRTDAQVLVLYDAQ
jgi:hypothetical protein